MSWNWRLIIIGAVIILVEVSLGGFAGFDLVLIGSALMLGGGIGLLLGNTSVGLLVASALCLLYVAVGRRMVRAQLKPAKSTPSNVDALIGVQGTVTQRIAPFAPGQVKVRDEVWRAEVAPGTTTPIEPGAVVTVAGVSGATLQVR